MPVQDVYDINGKKITVGSVLSGRFKKHEAITVFPCRKTARINSIAVFGKPGKTSIRTGESAGLMIDDLSQIKRGDILASRGSALEPLTRFNARIFWMSEMPLKINTPLFIRCSTQRVKCHVAGISARIDSSTLETIEVDSDVLHTNEMAGVTIDCASPIILEDFDKIEELGRFILERDDTVLAAGIYTG